MWLHLLATEAPAHPQALHGHLVAAQPQDVGHDLLGLRRVLGAALHEHLAALVDVRQGAEGLEVEVLLAGELELAAEHVGRGVEAGREVTALDGWLATLELVGRDRLLDVDQRGQRLVSTSTALAPSRAASRVSPSTQQTAWPKK